MPTFVRQPLGLCALMLLVAACRPGQAQNPNYPGYLGVYVVEGNGGMQITDFIPRTPAAAMARQGEISRSDTILRLAGRPTRTLSELRAARNRIPMDKEGKMILRDRRGDFYFVWISRSAPVAMSAGPGGVRAQAAPADVFRKGGRGTGDDRDFRDKVEGSDDGGPEARDSRDSGGDEGEFRDKR